MVRKSTSFSEGDWRAHGGRPISPWIYRKLYLYGLSQQWYATDGLRIASVGEKLSGGSAIVFLYLNIVMTLFRPSHDWYYCIAVRWTTYEIWCASLPSTKKLQLLLSQWQCRLRSKSRRGERAGRYPATVVVSLLHLMFDYKLPWSRMVD